MEKNKKVFDAVFDDNLGVIDLLKATRLFGHLPPETLDKITPLAQLIDFPVGADILTQGETNTSVFFLLRGEVEVLADGESILILQRRGDIFGEMSIISNRPCTATVRALTKVRVFAIQGREIGHYAEIDQQEISNVLYRLFAEILVDKLTFTTFKAKQFEEAKREAEEGNQAKSKYLAIMSHEIRNPMNGIVGMTSLLRTTPMSREQEEYVNVIRNSGDNLLMIINDILDFSKLEAGKLILEEQSFSPRSIIEDSFDIYAAKAAEKHLEMLYRIEDGVPEFVVGDSTRVRQILINLVGNALKFTSKGQIFVELAAENTEEGVTLRFGVVDSGIGIPMERLRQLFKPFNQTDPSIHRHYGGTGLGLAIVKELCLQMEGDISVKSEVNQGSTFEFTLKVKPSVDGFRSAPMLQLGSKRVLIICPRLMVNSSLGVWLAHLGLLYDCAESPKALGKLLEVPWNYDLVILDFDHINFFEESNKTLIQKAGETPWIYIGFMGQLLQVGPMQGNLFFLNKPLKQNQLTDAITQAFLGGVATAPKVYQPPPLINLAARFPMRILLAEDNVSNQMLFLRIMEKLGYVVDSASNGIEATEAVKRQKYDLVFMDINMPEMDGLEATREILKGANPPVIIAVTANAFQDDKNRYLAAGMLDYVSKPYVFQSIKDLVTKWGERIAGSH